MTKLNDLLLPLLDRYITSLIYHCAVMLKSVIHAALIMHISIVVPGLPAPRTRAWTGNVPGVYENIVPRCTKKYPGHSGDVTHPGCQGKVSKDTRALPGMLPRRYTILKNYRIVPHAGAGTVPGM